MTLIPGHVVADRESVKQRLQLPPLRVPLVLEDQVRPLRLQAGRHTFPLPGLDTQSFLQRVVSRYVVLLEHLEGLAEQPLSAVDLRGQLFVQELLFLNASV